MTLVHITLKLWDSLNVKMSLFLALIILDVPLISAVEMPLKLCQERIILEFLLKDFAFQVLEVVKFKRLLGEWLQ